MRGAAAIWLAALALAACSGKAVVDGTPNGGGGAGGSGAGPGPGPGSTTTTTNGGPVTTGGTPCSSHDQCPGDSVCIFSLGTCARRCDGGACDSCDVGSICDDCATSSCPGCADCVAACRPQADGECDDDDPCKDGAPCLFFSHQCADPCDPNGGCAQPGYVCADCVTSSCCGCDNCVSACIMSI